MERPSKHAHTWHGLHGIQIGRLDWILPGLVGAPAFFCFFAICCDLFLKPSLLQIMSHQDIMCEVEISDSSIVEVVDTEHFSEIGAVPYENYEVGDDQYEEVTCKTEDSQELMMQNIDDGEYLQFLAIEFLT